MLEIKIPACEYYDEIKNEFVNTKEQVLCLEHSLVSISKWEAKYKRPFISKEEKTMEETIDYIRMMTLTQKVKSETYDRISNENLETISNYISDSMTATQFYETEVGGNQSIITSEIIYYWMIAYNIPYECQKWHLNRLLTLVRVCSVKQSPKRKMSSREIMERNRRINEERKKKLNTKG